MPFTLRPLLTRPPPPPCLQVERLQSQALEAKDLARDKARLEGQLASVERARGNAEQRLQRAAKESDAHKHEARARARRGSGWGAAPSCARPSVRSSRRHASQPACPRACVRQVRQLRLLLLHLLRALCSCRAPPARAQVLQLRAHLTMLQATETPGQQAAAETDGGLNSVSFCCAQRSAGGVAWCGAAQGVRVAQ